MIPSIRLFQQNSTVSEVLDESGEFSQSAVHFVSNATLQEATCQYVTNSQPTVTHKTGTYQVIECTFSVDTDDALEFVYERFLHFSIGFATGASATHV
jgi:hypothetical protein